MKRPASRLNVLLLGAALLAGSASCKESCPTAPDLGVPAPDQSVGQPDQPSWPSCKKDKVSCGAGERSAFGICQGEATMAKVAAGELTMGLTEDGKPWSPEHKVTLKGFVLDLVEVTVAAYQACVDCGVCTAPMRNGSNTGREPYFGNPAFANHPVIYVTWKDAKTYCEAVGKRLPSEAEWEMAARGPSGSLYPWGATAPGAAQANFAGLTGDTEAVTSREGGKAACGALNLAGNVWEWVADGFDPGYYASSPTSDPKGPTSASLKVARGGGFNSSAETLKAYYRIGYSEGTALSYLGFRCAKDAW